MANIIDSLRTHLPTLSRQEAAVASVILSDPQGTLQSPVAVVATKAGVSQPTVIRLCRSVGCDGFADFKLKLAQSLVPGVPFVSAAVETTDGTATFVAKIFDATSRALHEARTGLDITAIERAIGLLAYARRIVIFGVGGSAPIAQDAAHKFSRFAMPVQALVDPVQTRIILTGMTPGDVFVAISNTGRTKSVLEMAEIAADNAVSVVAITAPASPLAALAAAAIGVASAEDIEVFTPMASRIVQLTVVDVLTTGIALRLGPSAHDLLARVKTGLKTTRLPQRD
jgi:RpiR family carbohydrate utilization transcriptional regulator